ncbi:hypothetical protein GCM10009630_49380 [Kribbella jejuensis]
MFTGGCSAAGRYADQCADSGAAYPDTYTYAGSGEGDCFHVVGGDLSAAQQGLLGWAGGGGFVSVAG